ncbi:SDR family NAD(P)-dependent oxidoreductase [Lewinella sp. JB7]|uniref:SDR family NAD(P)-dependent oxidoreductase n=1 Tax=Lewinella sp. JB7 TaxID=2962887 RepID=UPI0020C9EFAB|nr:SDR family NAD(P)-dependent oxidoreductase [Lewinella sp. JB7]MCP9236032.1 SDR family NAD(P)-dependent oxidoreductase [Lewinella sp. JB7]
MNKTILITGSTDGIGKAAAMMLAKAGHDVYLHGRNPDKLAAVIAEVKSASGNENVHGFVADFSVLRAVRNLGAEILRELPKLDVLINNAGVYKSNVASTIDRLDMRFAVNYFAPLLLTRVLLPLLRKGSAPRIINVSSAAQAPVSADALVGNERLSTQSAYAQSKLALTMWSTDLAQTEPGITVIAVNPGSLLDTKLVREGFGRSWSSADKGASILFDLAVAEKYANASGKYFDNDLGTFGMAHPAGGSKETVNALLTTTDKWLTRHEL